jgi:crossover junction endodeoxyribonuclease RusA
MIDVELPWPPSANRYWRNVRGRTIVSKEAHLYKRTVRQLSYIENLGGRIPLKGRLSVSIMAHPPDRRKRDLDNILKVTFDAMEFAGYFLNDSQIDIIHVERQPRTLGPGEIWVTLKEIC